MVDMQFILYTAIGAVILAIIALVGSHFGAIVSIVSGLIASARAEGEARRAYRQHVYTMSSSAELLPRTIIEPAEPGSRTLDTNHLEPEEPAVREPEREPVNLRQLPKQDLIVLLAVQRDEEGKYIYSSNGITKFVGGTAADVKALIATVRAEPPVDQAARLGHFPRPVNGWGN